ncbi:hypothetical protein V6N11_007082 [Hibiscus sabdariffa]|uniref:Uncharacterized protein n=1 Tax=Hibiscus sabdariffa TaxID=183260 RepID=A0ABR2RT24_9ROSI
MANTSVVICTVDGVVPFDWNLLSSTFVFASSTFIVSADRQRGSNHLPPPAFVRFCSIAAGLQGFVMRKLKLS